MKLRFVKMQVCGNDFILADKIENEIDDPASLIQKLSQRGLSVGSDGLIIADSRKNTNDEMNACGVRSFGMEVYDGDGREMRLSASALICVGAYLRARGICGDGIADIITALGTKRIVIQTEQGRSMVTADVGEGIFSASYLDGSRKAPLINEPVETCGISRMTTAIELGELYQVIFCNPEDIPFDPIEAEGVLNNALFTVGEVSAVFAVTESKTGIRVYVTEKGMKLPMSNGNGACAACISAARIGSCDYGREIETVFDGGSMFVTVDKSGRAHLRAEASVIFRGVLEY